MSIRSPNCIQHVLPASLKVPSMNNSEYRKFFRLSIPVYRNFTVTAIDGGETMVDVEKRMVSMYTKSRADTDYGEYRNEYSLTARMTEDGKQVEEVWEFVDSHYSVAFQKTLGSAGLRAGMKL